MNPLYAQTLFNFLYSKVDGYDVANVAQRNLNVDSGKFLYGEMPFKTWVKIIEQVSPKKDAVFFDLGSGIGQVVMQSHILFNFHKSIGVELLEGLHNQAIATKNIFEKIVQPQIKNHVKNRELLFLNQNIFDVDVSEADLILLNYPLKGEENFRLLEEKLLKELKPKTKIVATIRSLHNSRFKNIGVKSHRFSWGESTAYLYEV